MDLERLPSGARGVLPDRLLRTAIDSGFVTASSPIGDSSIQPASLDLRLADRAYRLRCSFLPDRDQVDRRMKPLIVDELDLRGDGAVLEPNRPYLIPLAERLELPAGLRAKSNPKSSTGRLDVFTRVITDHSFRFDEIEAGYAGPMYLEVVPLSFAVVVSEGLALNQLRLVVGRPGLTDDDLRAVHAESPLLYRDGAAAVGPDELAVANGMFLSLDLRGDRKGHVGYRARPNTPRLVMSDVGRHRVADYWESVTSEARSRIVLDPERFYLLLSEEAVSVPPHLAAEMTAFDPTSGELRTHYAGFFDPGFGFTPDGSLLGSRAALEVRAHDVPFMVEHRQKVCKLTFEHMLDVPDRLYGQDVSSNYQGQTQTLSKHFERPVTPPAAESDQLGLFGR